MKILDKIYINIHPLGIDCSIVPIPDFGGVEYIRKDAMLELLNEYKNNPVITELQKSNIQELIEKIESL